jgi:hypothetical protein
MTNNRRRPAPRPAPRPARPAEPGITAAWLSDLLAGRVSVPPGEYTVPASPAPKSTPELHRYSAQASLYANTPDPWPEISAPTPGIGTELHQWAESAFDRPSDPPCLADAEPLAVDAIVPAVVDVLNAITRRLEQLRDGGHPARADGVTEGEQAAWRAGLNRAIALTASSALIAAGVGQARRDGA